MTGSQTKATRRKRDTSGKPVLEMEGLLDEALVEQSHETIAVGQAVLVCRKLNGRLAIASRLES
ncbi:hypothetical protein Pla52n_45910 [Stieleria varia]|uniref:Uncharacterized protein n=1 Tax=Stieleria varia TaxID=2528005 RepID=A0A5C6APS1_9BACT|nr:hypothetical protein Pla52n_45910 [Stieleria varia]